MPDIQIKCPQTGRLVNTGMSFPTFDGLTLERNSFAPCPECGGTHVWSVRDGVILVDDDH